MAYCPNCKSEYVEGVTKCADCGADLTAELKEDDEQNVEGMEIVFSCSQLYEAEMVKANLEGAGIEAFILSQDDSNFPSQGDLSVVKILVKASDVKEALEFIESANNSNTDIDEDLAS
jgi:hypothetical protein